MQAGRSELTTVHPRPPRPPPPEKGRTPAPAKNQDLPGLVRPSPPQPLPSTPAELPLGSHARKTHAFV